MERIRAAVRPVTTVMGLAAITAMVLQGRPVPEFYTGMVAGMLAWWYYDRSKGKKG